MTFENYLLNPMKSHDCASQGGLEFAKISILARFCNTFRSPVPQAVGGKPWGGVTFGESWAEEVLENYCPGSPGGDVRSLPGGDVRPREPLGVTFVVCLGVTFAVCLGMTFQKYLLKPVKSHDCASRSGLESAKILILARFYNTF